MDFLWVSGALVLLASLVYFWSYRKDQYWPSRGFAFVGTDVAGNFLLNVLRKVHMLTIDERVYLKAKELGQGIVGTVEFGTPVVLITDLDLAKNVFIKDFETFTDRRPVNFEKTNPIFHKMLFFTEGEVWKELRGKMSPTFTTGKIKRMFELFESSSEKLIKYVEEARERDGGVVDLTDGFERITMDIIASSAFGLDAKTFVEKDSLFQRMGKKLVVGQDLKVIIAFVMSAVAPKVAEVLGLSMMNKEADNFFTQVITSAIRQREKSKEKRGDFLQLMLEARDGQLKAEDANELAESHESGESGSGKDSKVVLSDDIIVAQSMLFILAGFDTTQTLLLFALYELALSPEIQEKLAQQIRLAKNSNPEQKLTYETINQMEYLDKVVNETLRKYPPVARLERRTGKKYQVPGTDLIIPKGILTMIPTYSIQRDPEHFPNPEVFDPERFSPEVKNQRHPMAFQPFGHGPRNCIGMRFALTSAKITIANLVEHFMFEPSAKTEVPIRFQADSSSIKPEGGIHLKVTPRA